jgi:O-succinylbenzoic acid--CoA ligase
MFDDFPWRYWAKNSPNELALLVDDEHFTWRALSQAVNVQATILQEHGIAEHSVLAISEGNGFALVIRLLALWQLGGQALLLNPKLSPDEREMYLTHWPMDAVYSVDSGFKSMTAKVPTTIFWQAERIVSFILTSGSTGFPKAVAHQAKHHLASANGLLSAMTFEQGDIWLLSLPLFHVSGMGILWRWLLKGAALCIPTSPQQVLPLLSQVTHASLVPTQLQRWLSLSLSTRRLKQVLLGGATIPISLTDDAEEQGIACWCGYGMTEMASTVTVKRANGKAGVGDVLPYRQLKLENNQIFVKGESLSVGYLQSSGTLMALTDKDGWFATKDRAHRQEDEWVIDGRLDNMFISGGENIQPEEIERVLLEHPDILTAFVLPKKNEDLGLLPIAILQTTVSMNTQWLSELAVWLSSRLMTFKQPRSYFLLPENLMSGGIKIPRIKIQRWFDDSHVG